MDETDRRFSAFMKDDSRRPQILQNKLVRLKTGLGWHTPTKQLLEASGDLSVQQLVAYHTVMTVFKVLNSDKPAYICSKLELRRPQNDEVFPQRQKNTITVKNCRLSLSRGGFIYRGSKLFNSLPLNMRIEPKISSFRSKLKKWVRENVNIKAY